MAMTPILRGIVADWRALARGLWKDRGFSAVVVITLALATGASSAMFSVLRATLFRPPPFPGADRLVIVSVTEREPGRPARQTFVPTAQYEFLRDNASSFEDIAAFTVPHFNVTGYDQPERVEGELVSARYFRVLGVSPIAGRDFNPDEDAVPGAAPVVVISHGLWQRRFGADPAVVGNQLSVNRTPLLVVGIMPRGFRGLSGRAELWMLRSMAPILSFPYQSWNVIARLRRGRTLDQAESELRLLSNRMAAVFPDTTGAVERTATATWLTRARIDFSNRNPIVVLLGAVGVLLLIACANTANLLLVRARTREREVAVRLAVGSSRWRLIRLLLTESLILANLGGAAGLLFAYAAIGIMTPLLPPRRPTAGVLGTLGDFATPELDLAVLGFAWALVVVTAILFGLAPAVRAAMTEPAEALTAGGQAPTATRWRALGFDAYGALTISEMALAVVLLAGSGLLLRSLWRLESMPLGFDTEPLITFQVQAPLTWYAASEAPALVERLVDRVSTVPGVEAAAATYYTPFDPGAVHTILLAGSDGVEHPVGHHHVTPDYFRTLGIPLLRGRAFTPADRLGWPRVAVVGATAASRFWPGEDPIGKQFFFRTGLTGSADSAVEVVGIARDVHYRPSAARIEPDVYTPYYQFPSLVWALVIVRSTTPPATLVPALREAVTSVDRNLPIDEVQTMEDRGGGRLARQRLNAVLLSVFAGLALAIATIGVYGVVSRLTTQRTREFGIRIALGAGSHDLFRLVLARAVVLIVAGLVLGVVGALALTRVLTAQLFGVGPADPATFAVISGALAVTALAASWIPARRATRVEPLAALRTE